MDDFGIHTVIHHLGLKGSSLKELHEDMVATLGVGGTLRLLLLPQDEERAQRWPCDGDDDVIAAGDSFLKDLYTPRQLD